MEGSRSEQRNVGKLHVFKFLHNPNTKWSHVYHSAVSAIFCTYSLVGPIGTTDGIILSQNAQLYNHSNATCPREQLTDPTDSLRVVFICIDAFLAGILINIVPNY